MCWTWNPVPKQGKCEALGTVTYRPKTSSQGKMTWKGFWTWNLWFEWLYSYIRHLAHNQFSSVTHSCPTLCDPMNHSMPGLLVHHQLPELIQTHVHQVGGATQPSHPLSSPSSPVPNPSQHQGLFQWVSSPHQVAKELELQLQHQSFQWTPRTDLLWPSAFPLWKNVFSVPLPIFLLKLFSWC